MRAKGLQLAVLAAGDHPQHIYEDLASLVTSSLAGFEPHQNRYPIQDHPVAVDWHLKHQSRNYYIFGVPSNDKAKNVVILLLELQKADAGPYLSFIVHEDMESLGSKERVFLTRNADKQYPKLADFVDKGQADILRFAA